MRQAVIPRIGGPEVFEIRESDDPTPGPGEVRIRVRASGVNFADVMTRVGLYPDAPPLPMAPGYEVSGVVDDVGEGVDDLPRGTRVCAATRFYGYADVVVVRRGDLVVMPEAMTFEEAASIPVNYLTAWLMLVDLGNVQARHTVLVHAAAGGVGQAAMQICRVRGAKVIATASPGKHERLREQGAIACIDSRGGDVEAGVREATGGRGVDIALDAIGGRSLRTSYRCLAPTGRVFAFGISSFAPGRTRSVLSALRGVITTPRFGALALMNENRGVFGVNLGRLWDEVAMMQDALSQVVQHFERGEFEAVIDSTFSLDKAGDAHMVLQERRNFGKVLLLP